MYEYKPMPGLIGKKVTAVRMDEDHLAFVFDDGTYAQFVVDADCCSSSYFYDFIGVDKLLANGPVLEVHEIDLNPVDVNERYQESVQCYGFSIVTESPKWGEQTSVFSFRNDSNGYYGGSLNEAGEGPLVDLPDLAGDVLETAASGE